MNNMSKLSEMLINSSGNGSIMDLIWSDKFDICSIDEFFRKEQEKPAHLRSNSVMMVCYCKKCRNRYTL
jgi:hypothetical protein